MQEVAPLAKPAAALIKEGPAFLGLVLRVQGVVPFQLVGPVRELALALVGAVPLFHELPA